MSLSWIEPRHGLEGPGLEFGLIVNKAKARAHSGMKFQKLTKLFFLGLTRLNSGLFKVAQEKLVTKGRLNGAVGRKRKARGEPELDQYYLNRLEAHKIWARSSSTLQCTSRKQ